MPLRLVIPLLFLTFALGFLLGRGVAPVDGEGESDILLSGEKEASSAARPVTPISPSAGRAGPQEKQRQIPDIGKPVAQELNDRAPRAAFLRVYGPDGIEQGTWPLVSLGEGRFLSTGRALVAATAASLVSASGPAGRVHRIVGETAQGRFLVLEGELKFPPWRRTPQEKTDAGEEAWLWSGGREADLRPVHLLHEVHDPVSGTTRSVLQEQMELARGAFVVDGERNILGLALPRSHPGPVEILDVRPFDQEELRILDLTIAAYYRLYFEDSLEVLLARARHAQKTGVWQVAIDTFQKVLQRDRSRLDEIREDYLRAVWSRLKQLPAGVADQGRLSLLRSVLVDLDDEGDLWLVSARAPGAVGDWEWALGAWDEVLALGSDRLDDVAGARSLAYVSWVRSLLAQGRKLAALDAIDRALSEVGGRADLYLLQADLLVEKRRFQDAAQAMRDAVTADPDLADTLEARIARAESLAEGPGRVVIDYPPGSRSILVQVRLNNRVTGTFIVDTGATSSMVPVALAQKAGLDTSERVPRVVLNTAGSQRVLPFSPVQSMALGRLEVRNLSVVVGDLSGGSGHGLLGMDFLGRFHVVQDNQHGRLVLTERQ